MAWDRARVACAAYLKQGCIGLALEQGQILQGLLVEGLLGSGGLIVHLRLQHDPDVRYVTAQDDVTDPYSEETAGATSDCEEFSPN